jgi:ComF family protein
LGVTRVQDEAGAARSLTSVRAHPFPSLFNRWREQHRLSESGELLRRSFNRAIDLLLPPTALDDGERPQSPGLSARAWERIEFLEAPVCDGCGSPFPYDLGPGARCAACMAAPRAFARARAACLYDEHSRDLILKLKHADRTDLASLFARWIARAAVELVEDCEAVVPVPLHRSRLFSRRYNQAAEVARPLARQVNLTYRPDVLVRARDTGTQGGKSSRGRRINVKGAFRVPSSRRKQIEGRRVLLIDDVFTTGATVEACAKALLAAGAAGVDVAVIARVREAAHLTI